MAFHIWYLPYSATNFSRLRLDPESRSTRIRMHFFAISERLSVTCDYVNKELEGNVNKTQCKQTVELSISRDTLLQRVNAEAYSSAYSTRIFGRLSCTLYAGSPCRTFAFSCRQVTSLGRLVWLVIQMTLLSYFQWFCRRLLGDDDGNGDDFQICISFMWLSYCSQLLIYLVAKMTWHQYMSGYMTTNCVYQIISNHVTIS